MSLPRRLATALAVAASLIAPAQALANERSEREPVLTLSGAMLNCLPDGSQAQGLTKILTEPPASWDVTPLDPRMVRAWLPTSQDEDPYGYDQCGGTAYVIAERLKYKLQRYKNRLKTEGLADDETKIDIYGVSYGTLIARLCVKHISGCAALVDDLVLAVPPSHGSTASSNVNCNGLPYYHICVAIKPASTTPTPNVIATMNAGDETPYGENDPGGWIEYTTLRAQNDGLIYPVGSEKLSGAANWLMYIPNSTQQTTHGNWGGTGGSCEGRTDFDISGLAESIAAEMLDVTDRSTWLPTQTSVFDNPLSCGNIVN